MPHNAPCPSVNGESGGGGEGLGLKTIHDLYINSAENKQHSKTKVLKAIDLDLSLKKNS